MPPVSSGMDIATVARFHPLCSSQSFLERVFTENERAQKSGGGPKARFFAARFAAKEAVMKALGTGWGKVGWKDIEVLMEKGRPTAQLHAEAQRLLGGKKVFLSISCTREMAAAMAVIE